MSARYSRSRTAAAEAGRFLRAGRPLGLHGAGVVVAGGDELVDVILLLDDEIFLAGDFGVGLGEGVLRRGELRVQVLVRGGVALIEVGHRHALVVELLEDDIAP